MVARLEQLAGLFLAETRVRYVERVAELGVKPAVVHLDYLAVAREDFVPGTGVPREEALEEAGLFRHYLPEVLGHARRHALCETD